MRLRSLFPPSHLLAFPRFRNVTPFPLGLLQVKQTQCNVQEMVALAQLAGGTKRTWGIAGVWGDGGHGRTWTQVMLDHTGTILG